MRWPNLLQRRGKVSAITHRPALDQLHIYNALWSLPDHVSGMENSVLRRMSNLQQQGSPRSMTLLTFNPRVDVTAVKERLVGEGRLNESTRIRNIWNDLRQLSNEQLDGFTGNKSVGPIPEPTGTPTDEAPHFTAHRGTKSRVVRRTYSRASGTVLATHFTTTGQQRFILHDTTGTPFVEWTNPNELYKQWLKYTITEQQPAVLIIDDKKIGEFAHTIPDRTFNTVLFVHGSHLESPTEGPHGPILKARRNTINNLRSFDLVALQTEQQRDALSARGIDTANTRIIPSSLPERAFTPAKGHDREETAGIVVATLSQLKRVDHAIRAIHQVREHGDQVSLTVCGNGIEKDNLQTLVDDLDIDDVVTMLGQVDDVPNRLAVASFSLITSTSEGLSLAILESMAAGCIPITYDLAYGPRDIITHGLNGFIVPYGDIDAMTSQIQECVALPASVRERMRQAAVERAGDYGPAKNFERWSDALSSLNSYPADLSKRIQ